MSVASLLLPLFLAAPPESAQPQVFLPLWPVSAGTREQCRQQTQVAQRLAQAPAGQLLRGSGQVAWIEAAKTCAGVPAILVAAVRSQLAQSEALPVQPQLNNLTTWDATQRAQLQQARRWLVRAAQELERGHDPQGVLASLAYWSALVDLALDEVDGAEVNLERARQQGAFLPSTCDRVAALVAMARGHDLQAAKLAYFATLASDRNERIMTEYVLALALDRAGDHAGAAAILAKNMVFDPGRQVARLLQTWLPTRDQVYLEALTLGASGQDPARALAWWLVMTQWNILSPRDQSRARAHAIALAG